MPVLVLVLNRPLCSTLHHLTLSITNFWIMFVSKSTLCSTGHRYFVHHLTLSRQCELQCWTQHYVLQDIDISERNNLCWGFTLGSHFVKQSDWKADLGLGPASLVEQLVRSENSRRSIFVLSSVRELNLFLRILSFLQYFVWHTNF